MRNPRWITAYLLVLAAWGAVWVLLLERLANFAEQRWGNHADSC